MKLKSIKIALTPDWQRKSMGEYIATAELEGGTYSDNITVSIDPERTVAIVSLLEGCVVDAMARAAADFASEVQARIAAPPIEHGAISDESAEAVA